MTDTAMRSEDADAAERDRLTHRAYLAELLSAETDARTIRRRQRRINEAKFPRIKTLEAFDTGATPAIPGSLLGTLATCAWIDRGEPLAQTAPPADHTP
jgi:DNA replication protein DnaC